MKYLFILLLFPAFLIGQTRLRSRLDSLMRAAAKEDFSGVLLVADHGNPVYYQAFGYRDFAKKIRLEKTDVFELASISKQFTAMIVMMLAEKSKLSYDDPVEKYLEIPYKEITIRQLLTHTSGLPDYQEIMDKYWDKRKVAGNEDILFYLNKYAPPRWFMPGTRYDYSNTGYVLLASICEKAAGKDFIDMCREWIFRPVGMSFTDLRNPEQKARQKNFALGHFYVESRARYIRSDSFPSSDYTIWLGNRKGPGRISSIAIDLLKWDQALYTEKLVSKNTLDTALHPMRLNNGIESDYGFGWMIRAVPGLGRVVTHTGDNPGYKTQIIRYLDNNRTVIILNNNAHRDFDKVIRAIQEIMIQERH